MTDNDPLGSIMSKQVRTEREKKIEFTSHNHLNKSQGEVRDILQQTSSFCNNKSGVNEAYNVLEGKSLGKVMKNRRNQSRMKVA
mmetsp:Transcript_37039/g.35765  ORF Transcript_37039/g.35765 Transcript_37039/m.35765 type:complete len:84 (+) Transcript_37039:194-445(+)